MSSFRMVGRRGWRRPTSKALFLALLLVLLAAYTQMAFEMEWRTAAGRIGPGYFPRIVGVLGVLLALAGLVRSLRGAMPEESTLAEDEAGDADLGQHPMVLVITVFAGVGLVVVFQLLGAIVSGVLFLATLLWLFNRPQPVLNLAISLGLPLGLYLLFQTALNAGLPPGILPAF